MENGINDKKPKALVVVAHPDDHFIWMGGTIYKLKDEWDWHVLCVCNKYDDDDFEKREKSFKESCQKLGVPECELDPPSDCSRCIKTHQSLKDIDPDQIMKICKKIENFWNREANNEVDNYYDIIFTHSLNPHHEYGFHANHAETREALYRFLGTISSYKYRPVIAHFCYDPRTGGREVDKKEATHIVSLDEATYKMKDDKNFLEIFPWAGGDIKAFGIPKEEGFKILFLDSYLVKDKKLFVLPDIFKEIKK